MKKILGEIFDAFGKAFEQEPVHIIYNEKEAAFKGTITASYGGFFNPPINYTRIVPSASYKPKDGDVILVKNGQEAALGPKEPDAQRRAHHKRLRRKAYKMGASQ